MLGDVDIASAAGLFADPARAAMLSALMDVHALPATELAAAGGVAPSTASFHLGKLLDAGLIEVERHGRHRYFRLGGPDVARAVEALSLVARPQPVRSLRDARASDALRAGRTCYDHLAGRLGVGIADHLRATAVLTEDFTLGPAAGGWLEDFGLELPSPARRPATRACLDWSERRHHVAGALGAALAATLFERGWLRRGAGTRAVRITDEGRHGLAATFGLEL
jgi:DNA-binding transcriptional ArsR family regulator